MDGEQNRQREKIMDLLSGMITKPQAECVAKGEFGNIEILMKAGSAGITAADLSKLTNNEWNWLMEQGTAGKMRIKDSVYRILPPEKTVKGKKNIRRKLILGEDGNTIAINLSEDLLEELDRIPIERGDKISVKNLMMQSYLELGQTPYTKINRITESEKSTVTNYSSIIGELKNADIIGIVTEVGQVKRTQKNNSGAEDEVSDCKISDTKHTAQVILWGESARLAESMALNSWIKIEFCNIKQTESGLVVWVSNTSRILSSGTFASRIKTKRTTTSRHK